jgi:signal transduction histidine kinase
MRALGLEMGAIWLTEAWGDSRLDEQQRYSEDSAAPSSLVVERGLPPESNLVLAHLARTSASDLSRPIVEHNIQCTSVGTLAARLGIGASLNVPILVEGQCIGGLSLLVPQPRSWSAEEIALVEAVGRQLGTAAERLRLFQEVQRHADELAVALAQAQELDRLKNEFIQSLSHELRTPLAVARGYVELLHAGDLGELDSEQQNAASIVVRRLRMLSDLVEDITFILAAEARPLVQEPVALDELTRASVMDFRMTTDQAGLTLNAEIASDVSRVLGETVYLRRVLDNLLQNAVKFTPSGNTITVRVWQKDDKVILQVSDTGIGIPADQLDSIFERFYQVNGSTRRRYGGVGLGLALVKQVVENLGGDVSVESEVNKGSTFTVRLPVADDR